MDLEIENQIDAGVKKRLLYAGFSCHQSGMKYRGSHCDIGMLIVQYRCMAVVSYI